MDTLNQENRTEFGFQWHITNMCNLRCAHCYQEDYSGSNELDFDGLKWIADEIVKTLAKWGKKGDIAITGGEPLLREEMFPLINYLESSDDIASIDILSNGTLINESIVEQIRDLKKVRCVQISLDGAAAESHDAIRGKGTFDKVVAGVRLLRQNGISVNIMFTLQRRNMGDIPSIIDLATAEGISSLTIERFVPTGSGAKIEEKKSVGTWLTKQSNAGILPHEFGIFVRSAEQLDRAQAAVKESGLPFKILDEHLETTSGYVSICTMHLAKGLEFRAVAVMACDDEIIPLQERIETVADEADLEEVYNTERHLLYVACTRARDYLLVTSASPSSEFLDDLRM